MKINLAIVTYSYNDTYDEVKNSPLYKSFKKFNPDKEIFHCHFNRNTYHSLEREHWQKYGSGLQHQVQSQTEFITYRIYLWKECLKQMDSDYIVSCDTNDVTCLGPIDRLVDMFDLNQYIVFGHEKNQWPTIEMKSKWIDYTDYNGYDLDERKFLNAGMILAKKDKYIELLESVINNVLSKDMDTISGDQGAFTYFYNSKMEPKIQLDYTNKFGVNTFSRSHDEFYMDNNRLISKKHGTSPIFVHDNGWNHGSPKFLEYFKLKNIYE